MRPPTQAERAAAGRRRALLVAAALVLVLIVAGVGWRLGSGGNDSSPQAAGSSGAHSGSGTSSTSARETLAGGLSALTKPGKQWTTQADDLLPGGTFSPLHRWEGEDGAETLAFPEAVVVRASDSEGTGAVLAALDPADGTVLWKHQESGDDPLSCYAVAEHTRMLCGTPHDAFELLDPSTGKSLGSYRAAHGDEGVDSDRNSIYLGTYDPANSNSDTHSIIVAKLSATDLSQEWIVHATDPGPDQDEGDDFDGGIGLAHDSSTVSATYGYLSWTLSQNDGKQTTPVNMDGFSASQVAGGYEVGVNDDYTRTHVTDIDGNTVLDVSGIAWDGFDDASTFGLASPRTGRLGVGAALYDLTTGKKLWSQPDAIGTADSGQPAWVSWSPTGDQLLLSGYDSDGNSTGTSLLASTDGSTVWQDTAHDANSPAVWSADAVLEVDASDLVSRSRTDDRQAWTEPLGELASSGDDAPTFDLGLTDTSIVAIGDTAVRGFTAFDGDGSSTGAASGTGEKSGSGTKYVTECGSTPEFTPVSTQSAGGGIAVTFEVHATCPDGQWLAESGQRVSLSTDDDGLSDTSHGVDLPGSTVLAGASFDFSSSPHWISADEDSPTKLTLTFPTGTLYASQEELSAVVDAKVVVVACDKEPGSSTGDVPADPSDGAADDEPVTATGQAQDGTDPQAAALATLKRIGVADTERVSTDLSGSWVTQLSSKKQGTTDDGIVYRYSDILAEHLRLRLRYPDVRLVNSSDFGSFQVPKYWVTLVGNPDPDWHPPLIWCRDQGFDSDHCYAKKLLVDGPSDGASKHLEDLNP